MFIRVFVEADNSALALPQCTHIKGVPADGITGAIVVLTSESRIPKSISPAPEEAGKVKERRFLGAPRIYVAQWRM